MYRPEPGDPRAPRPVARPPHRTAALSRTAGYPRSSAIARAWFGDTIATAQASMPPVPDRPPRRHRPVDPDAPKGAIAPGPASKPPETGAGASTTGRRRGSTRPPSEFALDHHARVSLTGPSTSKSAHQAASRTGRQRHPISTPDGKSLSPRVKFP